MFTCTACLNGRHRKCDGNCACSICRVQPAVIPVKKKEPKKPTPPSNRAKGLNPREWGAGVKKGDKAQGDYTCEMLVKLLENLDKKVNGNAEVQR